MITLNAQVTKSVQHALEFCLDHQGLVSQIVVEQNGVLKFYYIVLTELEKVDDKLRWVFYSCDKTPKDVCSLPFDSTPIGKVLRDFTLLAMSL